MNRIRRGARVAWLVAFLTLLVTCALPTGPASAEQGDGCYYTGTGCNWKFSRSGAYSYANYYHNRRNSSYSAYSDNCTNFSSQVWHEGGGVPLDQYSPYWEPNYNTLSWQTAREFRTYWDAQEDYAYYRIDRDITNPYNPAGIGDVIVYDLGKGKNIAWTHTAVEHHYDGRGDYVAQNTTDAIRTWNYWYYHHSSSEQYWQRQHGYRIIGPKNTRA
jgi:hypothetical protein